MASVLPTSFPDKVGGRFVPSVLQRVGWRFAMACSFKGLGLSQQVAYAVRMDGHALLAKLMHKRTGEALPALSALKLNNESLLSVGMR